MRVVEPERKGSHAARAAWRNDAGYPLKSRAVMVKLVDDMIFIPKIEGVAQRA